MTSGRPKTDKTPLAGFAKVSSNMFKNHVVDHHQNSREFAEGSHVIADIGIASDISMQGPMTLLENLSTALPSVGGVATSFMCPSKTLECMAHMKGLVDR